VKHEELALLLAKLKLFEMRRSYQELARVAEKENRTYEQFFASLVKTEAEGRQTKCVERFLAKAKIPTDKQLDTYDFRYRTGISQQQMRRLADGDFVREGGNVVFYGSFGVGKSHLAMGLMRALCEKGYRCLFKSTHSLITDLIEAKNSLSLTSLFRRLDRFDVICCDELGFLPQSKDGADLFFELISQRYERKSLIITTNLTYSEWDKVFLNPITTAAAVDRIIHHCETFNILGPSWRAETAAKKQKSKTPPPSPPADESTKELQ
jgi:DNA replication protein DnaC